MDFREFGKLLIKTVSVVLVFWYLSWLPSGIGAALQAPSLMEGLALNVLPIIPSLLLAVFAFTFAGPIVNKFIVAPDHMCSGEFATSVQILAVRLVGSYYVFRSIIDLIYFVAKVYFRANSAVSLSSAQTFPIWLPDDLANIVSTLAAVLVAMYLTFRAEKVVAFFDLKTVIKPETDHEREN